MWMGAVAGKWQRKNSRNLAATELEEWEAKEKNESKKIAPAPVATSAAASASAPASAPATEAATFLNKKDEWRDG